MIQTDDNNFKNLFALYIEYEFSLLNLYLTEEQLNSIVKQLFMPNKSSITYSFTDEQLLNTKYSTKEDTLKDVLNIIENMEQRFEKFINLTDEERGKYSFTLAKRFANERLSLLYKNIPDYFMESRNNNITVQQSIDEIWGNALDLFDLLITTAINTTINYDVSINEENSDLYEALSRLQGRACLISNEILVLLRAGFPDGAYARCRTLYETMVISCFIHDNGNETAKRYLDYSIVNDLNEAKQFSQYNKIIEDDFIDSPEIIELEKEVNLLESQYGKPFVCGDYNWALNIIKPKFKNVKFWEIEKAIDLKNMKQFYKSSSNNIHTSSSSLYFHRGLVSEDSHHTLMGASDLGVETPCDLASHFINITTSNLILYKSETTEDLIRISILNQIREDLENCLEEIKINIYDNEIKN